MRDMALYAALRLGMWALLWWVLTLAGLGVVIAGVLAAIIAMLLSFLLLDRIRDSAAQRWKEADDRRRARRADPAAQDAAEEDALLEDEDGPALPR